VEQFANSRSDNGPIWSNWALIIVGIGGIFAAMKSLSAIQRQGDLMEKQISIAHRARLYVGSLEKPEGPEVRFPIENSGQVPGRIVETNVEIIFLTARDDVYQKDITQKTDETITPGNPGAFALTVLIPEEAAEGTNDVVISVGITYDTGFNSTDTLHFVRVYRRNCSDRTAEWVTASTYVEVDFMTLPQTYKTQNADET
jgi:hypothetical protein